MNLNKRDLLIYLNDEMSHRIEFVRIIINKLERDNTRASYVSLKILSSAKCALPSSIPPFIFDFAAVILK